MKNITVYEFLDVLNEDLKSLSGAKFDNFTFGKSLDTTIAMCVVESIKKFNLNEFDFRICQHGVYLKDDYSSIELFISDLGLTRVIADVFREIGTINSINLKPVLTIDNKIMLYEYIKKQKIKQLELRIEKNKKELLDYEYGALQIRNKNIELEVDILELKRTLKGE